MRIHVLPAFALLSLTAVAAPALKPKPTPFYFPTAVGTTWVYETADGRDETAVVAAVEKDGDDLIVSRANAEGARAGYTKMIVTADGLRQERELAAGKLGWVLKTKLKNGESWNMPEGGKRTVYGPETVEVPAGRFTALRVEWENAGSTFTSWYAPGVGEVKRVRKRDQTETIMRSLKSFTSKEERK